MGLKAVFSAMKKEGYIVKPLDLYLMSLDAKDADRAVNVNAPSAIGSCLRSRYYSRTGATADPCSIEPRTRRIFDNGTGVHERLQKYLREQGMLLMDEVPIINDDYTIQGHTDGILKLSEKELGVLEIKSINSRGFSELKAEKPEHRKQGLIYLYCLEEQRKYLKKKYATEDKFKLSFMARRRKYAKYYQHLKDGSNFTRKEKIQFQVDLCCQRDEHLYHCDVPLTKVIFLYENKDTQDLKEYCVSSNDSQSKELLLDMLKECAYLDDIIESGEDIPQREGSSRSDIACRWCAYKTECWN
jgi:hypothetical protein